MAGTSGTVQSAALVPPAACNSSLGASPLHAMWRRWGGRWCIFYFLFFVSVYMLGGEVGEEERVVWGGVGG